MMSIWAGAYQKLDFPYIYISQYMIESLKLQSRTQTAIIWFNERIIYKGITLSNTWKHLNRCINHSAWINSFAICWLFITSSSVNCSLSGKQKLLILLLTVKDNPLLWIVKQPVAHHLVPTLDDLEVNI